MCHIGLPPTNRNWGYCTMAFLSGSWTDDPNGTQGQSLCSKKAQLLRRKIYETRDLEIRLSLSSTRSPGILSKILVLNLRFKVANYTKSWFHGHSCTVLPITTARRRLLRVFCMKRCCGLSMGVSMSLRCLAEPSGLITPSHLHQPQQSPQTRPRFQGFTFSFHIWGKKFGGRCLPPNSIPFPSRSISWLTRTLSNMSHLINKALGILYPELSDQWELSQRVDGQEKMSTA